MKIKEVNRVVVSRTDSIGDVVLTLPMCEGIKAKFPDATVIFLAANYTVPVVKNCPFVDEVVSWTDISNEPTTNQLEAFRNLEADVFIHVFPRKEISDLAKKVKVKHRIGTSHRSFHLLTCNHRVSFTRKRSALHESQLNFHLLESLGFDIPELKQLSQKAVLKVEKGQIDEPGVVLHPKSKGSAIEWPIEKYVALAECLKDKVPVYISGTEGEGELFKNAFRWSDRIVNVSGKYNLQQFQEFIAGQKLLIACSTGPLHIAGALGTPALGLYTPKRPMHPGRWMPLGENSKAYTIADKCFCKKECTCVESIKVQDIVDQASNFI